MVQVFAGVPVRIYIPDGKLSNRGIVYYHGGGWVILDLGDYIFNNNINMPERIYI